LALSYGRIAKIAAQLSNGLVISAMGQIPCSTERISSLLKFQAVSEKSAETNTMHILGKCVQAIKEEEVLLTCCVCCGR